MAVLPRVSRRSRIGFHAKDCGSAICSRSPSVENHFPVNHGRHVAKNRSHMAAVERSMKNPKLNAQSMCSQFGLRRFLFNHFIQRGKRARPITNDATSTESSMLAQPNFAGGGVNRMHCLEKTPNESKR